VNAAAAAPAAAAATTTAAAAAAVLVPENCIVIAEGEVGHDGTFKVAALGFPSCERREELPAVAQVSRQPSVTAVCYASSSTGQPATQCYCSMLCRQ
jgi:hypothetical protein